MTSVEPMTREELLELASLDALGLLDEFEERLYARSLRDSPVAVQEEVLRMQVEIAGDLTRLLPNDQPRPQLREIVLKAVAEAIARHDAPLATIGRPRPAGTETPRRFGGGPSGLFWRAASFVLAGSALIMAYFLALGYQSSMELAQAVISDDAQKLEILLDPPNKTFLLDDSVKVNLNNVEETATYSGSLFLNERRQQVLIVVNDLPRTEDRDYVLQVQRPTGGTESLFTFAGRASFDGVRVDNVHPELFAKGIVWQIAQVSTGAVLLTSANT